MLIICLLHTNVKCTLNIITFQKLNHLKKMTKSKEEARKSKTDKSNVSKNPTADKNEEKADEAKGQNNKRNLDDETMTMGEERLINVRFSYFNINTT